MAKRIVQTTRKHEPMKYWIVVLFVAAVAYTMGLSTAPKPYQPAPTSTTCHR